MNAIRFRISFLIILFTLCKPLELNNPQEFNSDSYRKIQAILCFLGQYNVYCPAPQAPVVQSISPSDYSTGIIYNAPVTLTFSQAMDASTLTTNTSDGSCNTSIQISEDDFITCIPIAAQAVASAGNTIFTFSPKFGYLFHKTQKVRVTNSAKNSSGVSLASAYTSGGFTWFSVSGLRFHFLAHTNYLSDNTQITSWTDMSGNGNSVANSVVSTQPFFLTNQINGFPILRSNSTTTTLRKIGGTTGLGGYTAGSFFLVIRRNTIAAIASIVQIGTDPGYVNAKQVTFYNTGGFNIRYAQNTCCALMDGTTVTLSSTSNVLIYSQTSSGSNHSAQINGTSDGSNSFGLSTAGSDLSLDSSGGDLAELMYFDNQVSNANRDLITCYLGRKYNVTIGTSCSF